MICTKVFQWEEKIDNELFFQQNFRTSHFVPKVDNF